MPILPLLLSIIKLPFLSTLGSRLVNKYTGSGLILILSSLEMNGVLPEGISKSIDGLPTDKVLPYLIIAIGIWLVFHLPKRKTKIEKLQEELEILKIEKDIENIKKDKNL